MNINLSAKNISVLRNERQLFSNIDFQIQNAELWQISGENGSGKTSFLKILLGLLQPESGEIFWNEKPTYACRSEYHSAIYYLGHRLGLREELTVLENITLSFREMAYDEIDLILAQFQLKKLKNTEISKLSQGQRQRVAWARMLLSNAILWILDEPFAAIDQAGFEWMQTILSKKIEQGGSVILTTHRPLTLPHLKTRIFSLQKEGVSS